jgi:hypothetical protein
MFVESIKSLLPKYNKKFLYIISIIYQKIVYNYNFYIENLNIYKNLELSIPISSKR